MDRRTDTGRTGRQAWLVYWNEPRQVIVCTVLGSRTDRQADTMHGAWIPHGRSVKQPLVPF
jgi:hypothetical protein